MRRRYSKFFRPILVIGDLFLLNAAILLTGVYFDQDPYTLGLAHNLQYLLYVNLSWVLLAAITNPYKIDRTLRIAKILRGHATLVVLHFLVVITIVTFFDRFYLDQSQVLISYGLFLLGILFWRVFFTYLLRVVRLRGYNYRNVVIVGYGDVSRELQKFFRVHPEYGFKFQGYFDDVADDRIARGGISDLFDYAKASGLDEIYCCLPYVDYGDVNKIIEFGEENLIKVKLIADFRGFSLKGLELTRYDQIPVLNVVSTPLEDVKNQIVKRAFDIAFSSVVILSVMSWLVPIVALLIKLDSRGPVFFKQIRAGKDNSPFWCYKFRTMKPNGVSDTLQATKGDPRITKVGAFLRRTSLDEMPQFFNVFLGDMSIIGPRPHPVKLNEKFSSKIYKFNLRHQIKPGITGLAQIKGLRGETQTVGVMNHRVKYDRFYVEKWSLFLDIRILFSTISTLFKGDDNAY